jgi:hypothetical protein
MDPSKDSFDTLQSTLHPNYYRGSESSTCKHQISGNVNKVRTSAIRSVEYKPSITAGRQPAVERAWTLSPERKKLTRAGTMGHGIRAAIEPLSFRNCGQLFHRFPSACCGESMDTEPILLRHHIGTIIYHWGTTLIAPSYTIGAPSYTIGPPHHILLGHHRVPH